MSEALLRTEALGKTYSGRRDTIALYSASIEIPRHSRTAVVGRSGSGKTTLALLLAGVERPTKGSIRWDGEQVWPGAWRQHPRVHLMRQDSLLAMNPAWTVREIVGEPLLFQPGITRALRESRARDLALAAGLDAGCLKRRPAELSGGERQRVALARALAIEKLELLILDEPARGLDPESAEQLFELLVLFQMERRFAIILIAHDLVWARRMAEQVVVMDGGATVESSSSGAFFSAPLHPASRRLLEAEL